MNLARYKIHIELLSQLKENLFHESLLHSSDLVCFVSGMFVVLKLEQDISIFTYNENKYNTECPIKDLFQVAFSEMRDYSQKWKIGDF